MTTFRRAYLYILFGSVSLFGFISTAQATTVNDPIISAASVSSISSQSAGADNVSTTIAFTTTAAIAAGEQIQISAANDTCQGSTTAACQVSMDGASISGLSATVASDDGSELWLTVSSSLAAGSHSVTITSMDLPDDVGHFRFLLYTSASDTSAIASTSRIGTKTDPVVVGTPMLKGLITGPASAVISTYGSVYNDGWTTSTGFSSDEWGYYTAKNPGFSAGQSVTIGIWPDASYGVLSSEEQITVESSTTTKNIVLSATTKTISGSVTYDDTAGAVTTASVSAWRKGSYVSANVDSNGAYSLKVTGGAWEVCLNEQWDDSGRVEKDWYMDDPCSSTSFSADDSTESATVDFVTGRADARVTGTFVDANGNAPSQGGSVSFWNNEHYFWGEVAADTGAFSLAVVGGNSTTAQATSRAVRSVGSTTYNVQYSSYDSDTLLYWAESTIDVSAGTTLDLGTITLSERDVTVSITVQDEDGNPVEDIYVDGWQSSGGWTSKQTDANGQATLYLYEGDWEVRPATWSTTDYVFSGSSEKLSVVSGDSETLAFTLVATTLSVAASAITPDGLTATTVNGWVNCWSDATAGSFGGSVNNGSGSFGAIAGDYVCNLWVDSEDYMSGSEQVVTFVDGQDESLEFTLAERNASIVVNVKDDDNNLVTDGDGWVFAHSQTGGWTDTRLDSDGTVTLNVAAGDYSIGIWFADNADYISSYGSETSVTVAADSSATKTLTVFPITGTLTATLKTPDGGVVANAWVGCANWEEVDSSAQGDVDGGRLIQSNAQTGSDGVAVVGLVEGHDYQCWAGAPPALGLIGPSDKSISLTTSSDVDTTFTFQEATATIKGDVTLEGSSADVGRMWCGAWANEGYHSWDDASSGSYELNAIPDTWHVWCGTEVEEDGETYFYETPDETTVKITANGQTKTKNLTLERSQFAVPESVSETFSATEQKTIVLEDGTTLTIPANALASTGNVTVTAEPQLGAVRTDDRPFGIPWNFEAYDNDGVLISGDFNASVTVSIPYDVDVLSDFGVNPEDLLPKTYDTDTGVWETTTNVALNEDAAEITFTLAHFTEVGLLYNTRAVSSAPKAPRFLKAKKIQQQQARLTWKKPKDSTVTKYRLQLKKCKNDLAKACSKNKNYTKKAKWRILKKISKQPNHKVKRRVVKKLTAGTFYRFRVRACNGASCGNWTDWKRFQTATATE